MGVPLPKSALLQTPATLESVGRVHWLDGLVSFGEVICILSWAPERRGSRGGMDPMVRTAASVLLGTQRQLPLV